MSEPTVDTATRVALVVEFKGAEDIWMDLDRGMCARRIQEAARELFDTDGGTWLWCRDEGRSIRMAPDSAADPLPIGGLLEAGQLHRVILAAEEPPIRGG